MKKLTLALLACLGLSSCVVVPAARYDREVYVSPSATYVPSYSYRYYTY